MAENFVQKLIGFYQKRYTEMAGYQKPENDPPIREMAEDLMQIPDIVYGRYGFLREPIRGRLSAKEIDSLIMESIRTGEDAAEEYIRKFGNIGPEKIAGKLGLKVSFPKIPAKGGNVRFAEFEVPDQIRVFTDTFDRTDNLIAKNQLKDLFQDISIKEVLIGHELFHYVEMTQKDTIFTANHKVKIFEIGPFKNTSHVSVLGEIAAMSFSKKLTNLPFNPYFFDMFLTYSYNKELGIVTYNKIKKQMDLYRQEVPV